MLREEVQNGRPTDPPGRGVAPCHSGRARERGQVAARGVAVRITPAAVEPPEPDPGSRTQLPSVDPAPVGGSTGTGPGRSRVVRPRRRLWLVNSLVVAVLGITLTVLGARSVSQNEVQKAHEAAVTTSFQIASNLTLALKREQDLAVNAGAFIVADPAATQVQFQQWTSFARVFQRYPEVLGIAEVIFVPQAQLAAYAAEVNAQPAGLLPPGTTFTVTPTGTRPYYCFPKRSQSRTGQLVTPVDTDICDSPLGPGFLSTMGSGQGAYLPYGSGTGTSMVVGTPIYRPGAVTDTPLERASALLGWTGTELNPDTILRGALGGHKGTAVIFHYSYGNESASFSAGAIPAGADRTTIGLHNGWSVQVLSTPVGSGLVTTASVLWVLLAGLLLSLLLGALIFALGTGRSRAMALVHERTDELRHQALHDALTGLPNRALILDRVGQMLALNRREHLPVAVLFLDLDDFKDINDTLGHRAGDDLLVAVGVRLTSALREGDTVGRLGGDEFVVLTQGAALADGGGPVADRILAVMADPFLIDGSDLPLAVSASIGYAEGDRATPEALLQDADIALYQAKALGKHQAVRFSPSMQSAVDDHRHLEVDLRGALEAGQFRLEYQPIVALLTGTVVGVEALIRWDHPERGVVAPDEFVPALEANGPILEVGAWVLHEACRQGARWHRAGHPLAVSVNVSARQFEGGRILDDVGDALAASSFDPNSLILELTETVVMHDVEDTVRRLNELKVLGVRIAIDDFGTGYSSLAYLRKLPIDILKIDRSFVSGLADTEDSEALVHTLTQLGKLLGLHTVAEGIETDDQWRCLLDEGADSGQGNLFSRPLTPHDLDHLLSDPMDRRHPPVAAAH